MNIKTSKELEKIEDLCSVVAALVKILYYQN